MLGRPSGRPQRQVRRKLNASVYAITDLPPLAEPYYESTDASEDYTPEDFASDGFIHCTDGVENVIATAHRYCKEDAP